MGSVGIAPVLVLHLTLDRSCRSEQRIDAPSEILAASSFQAADFCLLLALSIEDAIKGSVKRMRSMASSSEWGHRICRRTGTSSPLLLESSHGSRRWSLVLTSGSQGIAGGAEAVGTGTGSADSRGIAPASRAISEESSR
jgi:hypothetical protein